MQNEYANHGVRHEQGDFLRLGFQALEYPPNRGAHRIRVGEIGFDSRGHNRAGGKRLDGHAFEASARARPARRSHRFGRDFAGQQRMRSGVKPAWQRGARYRSDRFPGVFPRRYSMKVTLLISLRVVMPGAHFGQGRIAQEGHALVARGALDFRGRPAADDHFANRIGKIQQLGDGRASAEARAGTFQASRAFGELHSRPRSPDPDPEARSTSAG